MNLYLNVKDNVLGTYPHAFCKFSPSYSKTLFYLKTTGISFCFMLI